MLQAATPPRSFANAPIAESTPMASQDGWEIDETNGSVRVVWRSPTEQRTDEPVWLDWPLVELGGRQLPARLLTFTATGPTPPQLRLGASTSRPWNRRTLPGQPIIPAIPQPLDQPPRPHLTQTVSDGLPTAPVIELRRGRMAGVELLVVAISPLYGTTAAPRQATSIDFTVSGGRLLASAAALPPSSRFILDDPTGPAETSARPRLRVTVSAAGMQEIPLAALTQHKLISDPSQLPFLQVTHRNAAIAAEIAGDRLRFYAPAPGDRWNQADFYSISLGDSPGLRMTQRGLTSDAAPALPSQNWAWETGVWSAPTLYDSTLAGQDGDHWFGLDLRAGPELAVITHTLPISSVLPPLSASATVTLHVTGYTKNDHQLRIVPPAFTATLLAWEGSGERSLAFAVDSRGQNLALVTVEGAAPDGVMVDSMTWQRPVSLRFGFADSLFVSGATETLLQLEEVAAVSRLYDISDPRQPVRVDLPAPTGGSLLLESAPYSRFLLLADQTRLFLPLVAGGQAAQSEVQLLKEVGLGHGSGHLETEFFIDPARWRTDPQKNSVSGRNDDQSQEVELLPPLDFGPFLKADALYIAPALFHPALQPLLDQRASQGYRAALVDVAQIYEGWSGGQVDPAAIRDFVRWRTANGSQPPQAVVLVGDATSDPRNYTGRNNTNFVPPFLLPVDPWLGETACDTCFGQVDGLSPLDDSLPDIPVGRIPAKRVEEVAFYVEKLLGYERTPAPLAQRSRMVFVADNYRDASGWVDGAGDFAISAQAAVAQQPPNAQIERVYFDPSPSHSQDLWREADPVVAWRKTQDALNRGGGFVSYTGHAHQWQWASTDLNVEPPYLLGLYDADGLTNGSNLPVLLEMSCLTGMFQFSSTTIDERLLLHTRGGAAAIWSSTGFGVAYGHDALQRGFYSQFWSPSSSDKRLGALTQAGYLTLFAEGLCCQESLRTFVILGDPLTVPQAAVERKVWMPWVER